MGKFVWPVRCFRNSFRPFCISSAMAQSKFEYVKQFEIEDKCLPNCWIVVRVDGKGFRKFSDAHNFTKPNDGRALNLMNKAAICVMNEFRDICISYGNSDEYSFVFKRQTEVYKRRSMKLVSVVCSLFASSYVFHWRHFFPETTLKYPPAFDGRTVMYPSEDNIKDYLSWRQADCHINNLYNTTFWTLVQQGGLTQNQAQERLKGTVSGDKNEILFSQFGINYNKEPEMYRKGTVIVMQPEEPVSSLETNVDQVTAKPKKVLTCLNVDIIGEQFWKNHPEILDKR